MPSRRGRRHRNAPMCDNPANLRSRGLEEFFSEFSLPGSVEADTSTFHGMLACTWCKRDSSSIFSAPCGHKYCRKCVEDVVLSAAECPLDHRFINRDRLMEFVVDDTSEFGSDVCDEAKRYEILKARVDSLTVIMDRLIEHLSIKNMVIECRRTFGTSNSATNNNNSVQPFVVGETAKIPVITDSEDSEGGHISAKKVDAIAQDQACKAMNLKMLCDLPDHALANPTSSSDLLITRENVRQLLPRFWKKATAANWSDDEKVVRLRMICDSALQRLLDTADFSRKDWAYISATLYGDHLLDEVSMLRCLRDTRQKVGETPHQFYLRVCELVERGLPPGPEQDWEIRASFVRGLRPKYQHAVDTGKLPSIATILQKCSQIDLPPCKPSQTYMPPPRRNVTCYNCGGRGHIQRDCPESDIHRDNPDVRRWTPWND